MQVCGSHAAEGQAKVLCSDCKQRDAEVEVEEEMTVFLGTTKQTVF